MMSKVSIIVPVFNTSSYLERCLDSLVNQTMREIEIICIDDASTDNSGQIINKYSLQDSRIKLIKHENNLGLAGARNSGIGMASSEYILCVDSDDRIHTDAVRRLWEASKQGLYDVVCFGYHRLSVHGHELSRKQFISKDIDQSKKKINIFKAMNPSLCNKLWKKDLFDKNGISQPEGLYFEDMAVTPLLLANSERIKYINDCLYFYYSEREGSITTTFSAKHIIDYFKVYEFLFSSLKEFNLIEYYLDDLNEYINKGLYFHANKLVKSDLDKSEIDQYLRYMLILKTSFYENHKKLLKIDQQTLIDLLVVANSLEHLENYNIRAKAINNLSKFQLNGIKLYSIVLGIFITSGQKKKLKETPVAFFYDSNHPFTRFVGRVLRII